MHLKSVTNIYKFLVKPEMSLEFLDALTFTRGCHFGVIGKRLQTSSLRSSSWCSLLSQEGKCWCHSLIIIPACELENFLWKAVLCFM